MTSFPRAAATGAVAFAIFALYASAAGAQAPQAPATGDSVGTTGLTLYNQNFALVRQPLRVDLKPGANHLAFENVTAQVEPDSVVLRDPTDRRVFRIQEQSYRNDAETIERLLPRFVGKTLQFLPRSSEDSQHPKFITGKLIRVGARTSTYGGYEATSLVEVNGQIRFGLPGAPVFPPESLAGLPLHPTLRWTLLSETAGPLNAELAYLSGGFGWQASYNLVAPETGDTLDLVGWVTMANESGRTFENARIQLVAGDVHKSPPERIVTSGGYPGGGLDSSYGPQPPVTEKAFDEYHLYTLRNLTTLRDHEQKQVEFARGTGIASRRLYLYDGEQADPLRSDWLSPVYYSEPSSEAMQSYAMPPNRTFQQNTKVWVMREFANTTANGLGIPLPKGRMRLYRRENATGALQFVGEGIIGHTPANETIRLYTGDAFDIAGERRSVGGTESRKPESGHRSASWEIKLRNHKKELVEVRVVEHMHPWEGRGDAWTLGKSSDPWTKLNAFTVEFRVSVKPDEEKIVTYSVNY